MTYTHPNTRTFAILPLMAIIFVFVMGLDRLTSASGPYATILYTYDQIGNMMYNSQLGIYGYNNSGSTSIRPHAVKTAGGNTYLYDANGNMSSGAGRTFTYDVENRPTTITTVSGTVTLYYDGNGNRVKKVSGTNTTLYIAGLYEVSNGVADKYVYAGGQRIVKLTIGSTAAYYYHSDHLGSSSIVTDDSGSIVEATNYYPYGATRSDTGTVNVHHKFTGQEYDAETGLYFYNARYYDPVLGRFISPDTIVQNPYDPQALNRYSYCRNNPVIYTDPSGHFFLFDDLIWAAIAWGAVGGGVNAALHGQDILQGMLIGGISGGIGAGIGSIASNIVGSVGGSIVGGAAGGATSAGLRGQDMWQGALGGGLMAGFGSMGIPNNNIFGDSAVGSIGNRLVNSAITGAAVGAVYEGLNGRDMWEGAKNGAYSWAIGEGANMAIGHTWGYLSSGFKGPTYENGTFYYDSPIGFVTLGNVTTGPYQGLNDKIMLNLVEQKYTFQDHEAGHMPQSIALGPLYIPAHILSMTVGGLVGLIAKEGAVNGSHKYNILENTLHPHPAGW